MTPFDSVFSGTIKKHLEIPLGLRKYLRIDRLLMRILIYKMYDIYSQYRFWKRVKNGLRFLKRSDLLTNFLFEKLENKNIWETASKQNSKTFKFGYNLNISVLAVRKFYTFGRLEAINLSSAFSREYTLTIKPKTGTQWVHTVIT